MPISTETANCIIQELKDLLPYQINLINTDSTIIASTDKTCVNIWHEGAKVMIDDKLSELAIMDENKFEGAKKGILLPIEINGEIIAVIEVTGEYEKVSSYGRIIKKMAEVLLQEEKLRDYNQRRKIECNNFIQEWVIDGRSPCTQSFISQGLDLGINIQNSWRIVLLQPDLDMLESCPKQQNILQKIEDEFARYATRLSGQYCSNGFRHLLLLPPNSNEALHLILEDMQEYFKKKYKFTMFIGGDSANSSNHLMHASFLRAEEALSASLNNRQKTIYYYNELDLEIIINDIPYVKCEEFVTTIFKNLPPDEIMDTCDFLNVFYKSNASISETAERLYLHKNTVQYKLNQITQKTGNNPRKPKGSMLFQMALALIEHKC